LEAQFILKVRIKHAGTNYQEKRDCRTGKKFPYWESLTIMLEDLE